MGFDGRSVRLRELPHALVESPADFPDFFPTFRADVTHRVAARVGASSGVFHFPVSKAPAYTGLDDLTLVDGAALFVLTATPGFRFGRSTSSTVA